MKMRRGGTFLLILVSMLPGSLCEWCRDGFGVNKTYASKPSGGINYISNWWKSSRTFKNTEQDPGDARCNGRGKAKWSTSAEGGVLTTISGDTPRYYCYLRNENVEITVYAKRGTEYKSKTYLGITLVGRTNHKDYKTDSCAALGYYMRLYNTGKMCAIKEYAHGSKTVYSKGRCTENVFAGGVPRDTWIGIKFVIQTVKDGVNLRGYIDKTSGGSVRPSGGDIWVLHVDTTDKDDWPANAGSNSKKQKLIEKCGYGNDPAIYRAGNCFFLRTDYAENYEWKYFSAREIVPEKPCGSTNLRTPLPTLRPTYRPGDTTAGLSIRVKLSAKKTYLALYFEKDFVEIALNQARARSAGSSSPWKTGRKQTYGEWKFDKPRGGFVLPITVTFQTTDGKNYIGCDIIQEFPQFGGAGRLSSGITQGNRCGSGSVASGASVGGTAGSSAGSATSNSNGSATANSDNSAGIIIGGVCGGVCGLLLCVGVGRVIAKRKLQKEADSLEEERLIGYSPPQL